jgi:hypothetical protein
MLINLRVCPRAYNIWQQMRKVRFSGGKPTTPASPEITHGKSRTSRTSCHLYVLGIPKSKLPGPYHSHPLSRYAVFLYWNPEQDTVCHGCKTPMSQYPCSNCTTWFVLSKSFPDFPTLVPAFMWKVLTPELPIIKLMSPWETHRPCSGLYML